MKQQIKKYFIKTYGCQMNEYDSERMKNMLVGMGYEQTEVMTEAEIVLMNTCHIREKATERMYSELGRVREHKEERAERDSKTIVIVSGCVAQAEGDEIFRRAKFVDIVVGPESYHNLPKMIENAIKGEEKLINLKFAPEEKFDFLEAELIKDDGEFKASSFVTVQEGCDKFCTFCVVPYTRGAEYSRKVEQVMDDVKRLVDKGTKEIVFLGQNVNAYHGTDVLEKTWNLGRLIAKTATINGVERIRYTTSHPRDMHPELIAMHASEPKLMPLLNLPVQSGSTAVLKAMNRKHTREEYITLMQKLKTVRPDMIFSSDFIVGFPGETDQDFEDTLDLIRQIKFESQCFSFKYSPRPGTPAANKDQVPDEVASQRLDILQDILTEQRQAFNNTMLGKTVKVLFDNKNMRQENQIGGRTEFLQIAVVDCKNKDDLFGKIFDVKITGVNNNSLNGELII